MANQNMVQNLLEELKRRRIMRVATLYVVAFWPIIQILDIASPTLGLSDDIMRWAVLAFMGGFPIVLILGWIFDINQEGIVRTPDNDPTGKAESGSAMLDGKKEAVIVLVLVVVIAGLFFVQFREDTKELATAEAEQADQTFVIETAPIVEPVLDNTIAVLPFVTFSAKAEDQYFADGLSEELLNVLAKISDLKVTARTSSFTYKGSNKNIQEIGRELGVNTILEGSVRRNDINNTVRVTAQLIEVGTGSHLWSESYDRKYEDVFQIQDDISASVVDKLKITLLGGESEAIKSRVSANPESMIAFSMGQSELQKRTHVGFQDAERYFKRAIEGDATYVDAYVGLAQAYALMKSYKSDQVENPIELAQETLDQAFALDPNSGHAWATQGLIYNLKEEMDESKVALEKAIQLSPNYAMAHMWYAQRLEEDEDRLASFKRAFELDPMSPVAGYNVAQTTMMMGREVEAMEVFSKIIEADPFYSRAYNLVAMMSSRHGRLADAVTNYQKEYDLSPSAEPAGNLAYLHSLLGNGDEADKWIAKVVEYAEEDTGWHNLLRYVRYASEGDYINARQYLIKLKDVEGNDKGLMMTSVFANFWLDDMTATLNNWQKVEQSGVVIGELDKNSGNMDFILYAAFSAAQAYKLNGDTEKLNVLVAGIEKQLEAWNGSPFFQDDYYYFQSLKSLIQDQDQLALISLQRAIDEGFRNHWLLKTNPIFQQIEDRNEFKTMVAALDTKLQLMRDQLNFEASFASM